MIIDKTVSPLKIVQIISMITKGNKGNIKLGLLDFIESSNLFNDWREMNKNNGLQRHKTILRELSIGNHWENWVERDSKNESGMTTAETKKLE